MKELRECKCPKNIHELTKSYFSKRTAVMATNTLSIEKEISRGCPQSSCSGPGMWNLQYNSSGHGKNRAYLHRFKLREEATCVCGKEDQTMDHILFNCIKTRE